MDRGLWLLYAYNINNGVRAVLAVASCPFKPMDNSPMYDSSGVIRQKWVKAFPVTILDNGWSINVCRHD